MATEKRLFSFPSKLAPISQPFVRRALVGIVAQNIGLSITAGSATQNIAFYYFQFKLKTVYIEVHFALKSITAVYKPLSAT